MKAVLFDLDNTLYNAEQYFFGAFDNISKYISVKYNISGNKVYDTLVTMWREKTSMYPYLFNDLLKLLNLEPDNLQAVIKRFNECRVDLKPYPDAIPTLRILKERGYKLGIITDGDTARQRRKIEYLALEPFFGSIVYAKHTTAKNR